MSSSPSCPSLIHRCVRLNFLGLSWHSVGVRILRQSSYTHYSTQVKQCSFSSLVPRLHTICFFPSSFVTAPGSTEAKKILIGGDVPSINIPQIFSWFSITLEGISDCLCPSRPHSFSVWPLSSRSRHDDLLSVPRGSSRLSWVLKTFWLLLSSSQCHFLREVTDHPI